MLMIEVFRRRGGLGAFTFGAKRVILRWDVEFTEGVEEGRLERRDSKDERKILSGHQRNIVVTVF